MNKQKIAALTGVALVLSIGANLISFLNRRALYERFAYFEPVKVVGGDLKGCDGFYVGKEDDGPYLWQKVTLRSARCRQKPYEPPETYLWVRVDPSFLTPVYGPAGLGR